MEWYWILIIIVGALLLLFMTGFPIAFCFMVINFAELHHLRWRSKRSDNLCLI